MSRKYLVLFLSLSVLFLVLVAQAAAKDLIPAGTILHCTMDEPNFSPKTATVGDPVLCHLGPLGSFGHSIFPRGAMLGGHLQDYKAPGHFFGKGWMSIEFDRMILPGAEVLPLASKIISAPHLKTDAQGDIHGKGHPKRDAILWMVPIFWPVKIFTLPARGPYPALKGETRLSLRLMEDVEVPFSTARNSFPAPPWASPSSSYRPSSPSYQPASSTVRERPAVERLTYSQAQTTANEPVTLIATQQGTALLARQYWVEGPNIHCVSQDGSEHDVPLSVVDLAQTVKLNQERNVEFNLHAKATVGPAVQQ